jgi:hypothetical protein
LAILKCEVCGRGLRVPDGRRGKVTCRCGAEWFHPPTVELTEVEFRCSHSGARFVVQLSRRSPLHKFVIQGIKNAPPRAAKEPPAEPKRSHSNITATADSTSQIRPTKPRGLMAQLFDKAVATRNRPSSNTPDASTPIQHSTAGTVEHDANEYNWASFICPYCDASGFVKCAGGHLACDGTARMRTGRRFHQCYCGNAGFIEGSIKTIEVDQHTFSMEPDMSTSSVENDESADAAKTLTGTRREDNRGADTERTSDALKLPPLRPSPRRSH